METDITQKNNHPGEEVVANREKAELNRSAGVNYDSLMFYSINGKPFRGNLDSFEFGEVESFPEDKPAARFQSAEQARQTFLKIASKRLLNPEPEPETDLDPFDGWEEFDIVKKIDSKPKEPKHSLANLVRVGQVMGINAAPKSHKSWSLMEFAICIATGKQFLKWSGNKSKVYYVDPELEDFDIAFRMEEIAKGKNATLEEGDITFLGLRGKTLDVDQLCDGLARKLKGRGYEIICIDAIYKFLGKLDENSNSDIGSLIKRLIAMAKELSCAVIYTHHFSKGADKYSRGMDKASGASAWSRVRTHC
jgi:AAA domain